MTPLHYAAKNGHNNVVEYLINNGADINGTSINFELNNITGILYI